MGVVQFYSWQGKSQSLQAWSRDLGIPVSTLRSRLTDLGYTVDQAFSTPIDVSRRPGRIPLSARIRPAPKLKEWSGGRAAVRWSEDGQPRVKCLGPWKSAEADAAYARFCAEWYANQGRGPVVPDRAVCVAELCSRYLDYAETTYVKRGKQTSQVSIVRSAMSRLNDVYGDTDLKLFTPERLRVLQARMEQEGLKLHTITAYRNTIQRCFSWGVSRGLVPAAVADALPHAERLVPGRTAAMGNVPVKAAQASDLDKIIHHLHPDPARQTVLESMVRLQQATGMRPQEVCELRWCDVSRERTPWLYCPPQHKTLHKGKTRRIFFGPVSRGLLQPYLESDPELPVFRMAKRVGKGTVAVSVEFLRKCLARACKVAGVPTIKPNQIRHTHGTRVQREYEDDRAVAAALGNSPEVARQVYVDHPGDAAAMRIAETLG